MGSNKVQKSVNGKDYTGRITADAHTAGGSEDRTSQVTDFHYNLDRFSDFEIIRHNKLKKIFKIVTIYFLIFSSFIMGAEILGQLVYLIKNGNFLFQNITYNINSKIFEFHPYLAGRPKSSVKVTYKKKTITTTKDHTRWTGAQQNDSSLIRIAILGGSTAFGTGVTDEDSWPALLQTNLGKQYAVINYGVPGYSTAENIIQMALIVPEKKPQIIIFYLGWNDIKNYHEKKLGADYYGHGIRQYVTLGIPISFRQDKYQALKEIFAIAWFIDRMNKKYNKSFQKSTLELFAEPDQFVDNVYSRNLRTLKLLSENIDAVPVFIPQVLNDMHYYEKKGSHKWTRHIEDEAMPMLMDRFNSQMNDLKEDNCMVLNEVLKEKWLPNDFIDEGHFSKSGGIKFAEIIARYIRSRPINSLSRGNPS